MHVNISRNYNNNNNNCLKSNIQCIEIRVQWTVHLVIEMGAEENSITFISIFLFIKKTVNY